MEKSARLEEWVSRFACPECKGKVSTNSNTLVCATCHRVYSNDGGVPLLLPDALRTSEHEDLAEWLQLHEQLEAKYQDLDGDSYRRAMRSAADECGLSHVQDACFWEKRLFQEGTKHVERDSSYFRERLQRNEKILNFLAQRKVQLCDAKVLNIGPGADTDLIGRLEAEGAEVMNCDVIPEVLRYLLSNSNSLVSGGDIRNLPFQPDVFDLVLAADVVHHTHPVEPSLTEIHRVLKRGGVLCMTELNRLYMARCWRLIPRWGRRFLWWSLRKLLHSPSRPILDSPYEDILTRREWTGALEQAGFCEAEVWVLNYTMLPLPARILNILDGIASCFSPMFSRFAWRYLFLARKE